MIHYHGTPCGGTRVDVIRFLAGRHALIPWVRSEDIGAAAESCQSFCLDNGAFTAWNSGEPITDWSGYYEFCDLWTRHPGCDFAIIPDVIDGDESDNDALISQWTDALGQQSQFGAPVWHMHESLERLAGLCSLWSRVCIGSSGEWPNPGVGGWWSRIADAMQVACDEDGRPRCKLHGLRMLDPEIFSVLPLASADSTNAVRNGNSIGRFKGYTPPTLWQRMDIIANRIEAHQSSAIWRRDGWKQRTLFRLEQSK